MAIKRQTSGVRKRAGNTTPNKNHTASAFRKKLLASNNQYKKPQKQSALGYLLGRQSRPEAEPQKHPKDNQGELEAEQEQLAQEQLKQQSRKLSREQLWRQQQARIKKEKAEKKKEKNKKKKKKINDRIKRGMIITALGIAIIADLSNIAFLLIEVSGILTAGIGSAAAAGLEWVLTLFSLSLVHPLVFSAKLIGFDMKANKAGQKLMKKIGGTVIWATIAGVIEMIPIIDLLPTLTFFVLREFFMEEIGKVIRKIKKSTIGKKFG